MPRADPSEIFQLEEKIGAGYVLLFPWMHKYSSFSMWFPYFSNRSYGAVYKARHKSSKKVVAAKIIQVDSDLSDLMKEVTILKGCRSNYIVRYYGSYYLDEKLWVWIVDHSRNTIDFDGILWSWFFGRYDQEESLHTDGRRNCPYRCPYGAGTGLHS